MLKSRIYQRVAVAGHALRTKEDMRVKIVVTEALDVRMEEIEDLKSLSLEVRRPQSDRDGVSAAIASVGGRLDVEHAWLSCDWLRAAGDPDWKQKFDAMIEYARSKDWVDAETGRVRAHIRWMP